MGFNTPHQRKSALITALLMMLLLVAIFQFGLRYLDPPTEYGVAIAFGDTTTGMNTAQKPKTQKPLPQPVQVPVKNPIKNVASKETTEKLLTQDKKDAPKVVEPKKVVPKEIVKEVLPEKKPEPKPSKETQDALNALLKNNTTDTDSKGKGDTDIPGVQGKKNGDLNSSKYYGNTGTDGDKNYNLAGRNALSKPIEKPDCQEEGIVVVSVEVDTNGKVIKAIAGVKGTTNSAVCLLTPARIAALKTTWNPDPNAPSKQRGTIIYKFSLVK